MKPMSLIITVLILFSVAASQGEEHKITCPNCNDINLPYPLSTSQNCGDPNYPLLCDTKTGLKFLSLNESYPVISIEEKNKTLIIKSPEIKDECKTADLQFNGLVIPEKSPFSISDKNTVMLFNCKDSILKSPLNCSSSSPCHRYAEEKAKGCEQQGLCCSFLKDSKMTNHQIRIREDGCTAYTSVVDLDEDKEVGSWHFGVQLKWD